MKNKFLTLTIFLLGLLTAIQARADVSLMAARIGAEDVLEVGEFYKNAFSLTEITRLELASGNVELILGFGEDGNQTIANMNSAIVILGRNSDAAAEPIPHLIFRVSDIDATYAKAMAAGGSERLEPYISADLGIKIAMLKDPAGNIVELIQPL